MEIEREKGRNRGKVKRQRETERERDTQSNSSDGRNKTWRLGKRSTETEAGSKSQRWQKRSGEGGARPVGYLDCSSVLLQGLGQTLRVASALGKPKAH